MRLATLRYQILLALFVMALSLSAFLAGPKQIPFIHQFRFILLLSSLVGLLVRRGSGGEFVLSTARCKETCLALTLLAMLATFRLRPHVEFSLCRVIANAYGKRSAVIVRRKVNAPTEPMILVYSPQLDSNEWFTVTAQDFGSLRERSQIPAALHAGQMFPLGLTVAPNVFLPLTLILYALMLILYLAAQLRTAGRNFRTSTSTPRK